MSERFYHLHQSATTDTTVLISTAGALETSADTVDVCAIFATFLTSTASAAN